MAALPLSLQALALPHGVAPLRAFEEAESRAQPGRRSLTFGWPSIDALLPDGGLPRGVVEIASRHALGGPTRLAARAVAAVHERSARSWCAWLDPEATLHAPGLARVGVDLARLFVVRPPRADLGRIAVKVARAGAFEAIVVDMDAVLGVEAAWLAPFPGTGARSASGSGSSSGSRSARSRRPLPPEIVVRKLALAAEEGECTIVLLTDASAPRSVPWPVALRLELERRPDALGVRVAKDHRGRASLARTWVPITELSLALSTGV
jgi:recombination protein RecA